MFSAIGISITTKEISMISILKKHSLNSNDSSKPVLMCLIDQDVNSAKQFKTLFNNQI